MTLHSKLEALSSTLDTLLGDALLASRIDRDELTIDVETVAERRRQTIPARRFGRPEEFGATCAFLCSAQAGYINGQNILSDGGAYPGTF